MEHRLCKLFSKMLLMKTTWECFVIFSLLTQRIQARNPLWKFQYIVWNWHVRKKRSKVYRFLEFAHFGRLNKHGRSDWAIPFCICGGNFRIAGGCRRRDDSWPPFTVKYSGTPLFMITNAPRSPLVDTTGLYRASFRGKICCRFHREKLGYVSFAVAGSAARLSWKIEIVCARIKIRSMRFNLSGNLWQVRSYVTAIHVTAIARNYYASWCYN